METGIVTIILVSASLMALVVYAYYKLCKDIQAVYAIVQIDQRWAARRFRELQPKGEVCECCGLPKTKPQEYEYE